MRSLRLVILTLAIASVLSAVQFRLRINMTWDETHPGGYPFDAHLSNLGVITHDASTSFWELGELATPGITKMAVTGCIDNALGCGSIAQYPTSLEQEAQTAISGGGAHSIDVYRQWFPTPGVTDVFFEVDEAFPYLTFATMIGPSPDWFVGVSGLNLRPGGEWIPKTTTSFTVYDGGVKSTNALIFNQTGPNENPPKPIAVLTEHPFGSAPVGFFELSQVPEPSTVILLSLGLGAAFVRRRRR